MTNQQKPKCGKGQSCGYSCIEMKDTCKELLDLSVSSDLVKLVQDAVMLKAKAIQSFTSAADNNLSFDELAAKYQFGPDSGRTSTKVGSLQVYSFTLKASDGSEDTMQYSVAQDLAAKRNFTVSDGLVKEVLASDRSAQYKEALGAALRAKAEANATKTVKSTEVEPAQSVLGIKPYNVVKTLGQGSYGEAVLTDRGTVVKLIKEDTDSYADDLVAEAKHEYDMLEVMHKLGIGPKPIAFDNDNGDIEMELAKGSTMDQKYKNASKEDKVTIAKNAYDAITKLHKAGYSHGDLHPGNVMFDETGKVTIIDAGFVGKVGEAASEYQPNKNGFHDIAQLFRRAGSPADKYYDDLVDKLDSSGAVAKYKEMRSKSEKILFDVGDDGNTKAAKTLAVRASAEQYIHAEYLKVLAANDAKSDAKQDQLSNKALPKDPTKAMSLDYLNVKLSEDHVKEFNKAAGMSVDLADLNNIVSSAVSYSNSGKWSNQSWANSEDGGKAFQKYVTSGGKYADTAYRGEAYDTDASALAAIARYTFGESDAFQSWSKSEKVAKGFASLSDSSRPVKVLYIDNAGKFSDIEKFTSAYHLEFTEDVEYRQAGASEREIISPAKYKPSGKVVVSKKDNVYTVTHNA